MRGRPKQLLIAVLGVALLMMGPLSATVAADDYDISFQPGIACPFGLGIDYGRAVGHTTSRDFVDRDGNLYRSIFAGPGNQLTFANLDTGATFATRSNGAVSITRYLDGINYNTLLGHQILIMFPSDDPAGPSTTLYVGQVTITLDNLTGVWTLVGNSGTRLDICAALS